jgi:hypothetical protein
MILSEVETLLLQWPRGLELVGGICGVGTTRPVVLLLRAQGSGLRV